MLLSTKLVHSTISKNLHKQCSFDDRVTNGQKPCAHVLYHGQWNINFRANRNVPVAFRRSSEMQTAGIQKGRPEDVAWAEAFIQVVRYCAENDEQITISDLCEKIKEYLK